MALERKDNIGDTSATTGTGTLNLAAVAQTGARIFAGNVTSGATVRYYIETSDKTEWEIGEGVFTDATPDTLTRVTVYASSNSNNLVSFSAGTKNVSLVLTALDMNKVSINAPQGFLINGKISITDAAGITVALKTLAGTDPSVTDPVYVRIGDTVRTITAALSVAKADGTNWCNSGGAELATLEVDYFLYLGYNATDGVVIGFSRINHAKQYSDFSATTTDEKYCAISTITNAASTDYYENIGRFAATLSAGAGYTWTVPTFTAANLIQRPIYEGTPGRSWTVVHGGFSANPTYTSLYHLVGNRLIVSTVATAIGTSNATSLTFTIPFKALRTKKEFTATGIDNGGAESGPAKVSFTAGSNSVNCFTNISEGTWTASGTKYMVETLFNIEI